ncbi:MAG TPA: DedA family protein [Vicinamibacterales bacterium]|nr:DedA family protein [Vicinamibacterales bacterium]
MPWLEFLTHWRYLGAFIGIFIEEAGVPLPVPGDVFIAALGAAGSRGRAGFLITTIVVFAATVSGSAVLFEISRRLGRPILERIGHRFGYSDARARRIETWLNTHGTVTVALGRLVPGFRILLTVAAGSLRMKRTQFLPGVAAASLLWAAIYYWLGYFLGAGITVALQHTAGRALTDPGALAELVTVVAALAAAVVTMIVIRRRRLASGDGDEAEPGTDGSAM